MGLNKYMKAIFITGKYILSNLTISKEKPSQMKEG
jgi:hypothetical protein